MNDNFNASEWQNFSLKKDVEKISKQINSFKKISYATIISVCSSVLVMILDHIIGYSKEDRDHKCIVLLLATFFALFPFIVILIKNVVSHYRKENISVISEPPKNCIDIFDNEICYYVMMSYSFLESLALLDKNISGLYNKKLFYYIETRFYINKSIDKLCMMTEKLDKVFEKDMKLIHSSKKVSVTRLENILDIIFDLINQTSKQRNILNKNNMLNKMIDSDEKYNALFDNFISKAHEKLGINIQRYSRNKKRKKVRCFRVAKKCRKGYSRKKSKKKVICFRVKKRN